MTHTDQMGRLLQLPQPPQRIISLVPSQTEFLHAIGLADKVVGITKFCIHPEAWFNSKTRVGGTKTLNLATLTRLQPDLIIANKEENNREEIEMLARHYPVWLSDIYTLPDALDMMRKLGDFWPDSPHQTQAHAIAQQIDDNFSRLAQLNQQKKPRTAAYLIWRAPYMVAASHTFIDDMLVRAGFQNVFAAQTRYPMHTEEQLREANPDYILLSSEPYPFTEKHFDEFRKICPNANIQVVNGEMFSWYGSKLLDSADYFMRLAEHK